jgi:hypothetical protein
MKAVLVNGWGKKIAELQVRDAYDALSLSRLYSNTATVIIYASNGRPCEMFVR